MAVHIAGPAGAIVSAAAPSTPLGPLEDSAVSWTTWITLMGFVGLLVLALVAAVPTARRIGGALLTDVTLRLSRVAAVFGLLIGPAVLTDIAHVQSEAGGYDYSAAGRALFDGSNDGRLLGVEVTLALVGFLLVLPLTVRSIASGRSRTWLLGSALGAGAIALGTTRFPAEMPDNWGRTTFDTGMWMLHLGGGAVWIGGLIGLLALALPGVVVGADRGSFWSPVIRRFSVSAMSCVGAIALSGLYLYWEHVDGPTQLFTTMYGRVLGVKIVIFGSMLLLGAANQFWLHPRIDALRAAGDQRPLRTLLAREFPVIVAVEVLLGLSVLMVAPFLHGSARNQAFQAAAAKAANSALAANSAPAKLPRIAAKEVSASTWVWGTTETVAVVAFMVAGYRVSGTLARRRVAAANPVAGADRPELVSAHLGK